MYEQKHHNHFRRVSRDSTTNTAPRHVSCCSSRCDYIGPTYKCRWCSCWVSWVQRGQRRSVADGCWTGWPPRRRTRDSGGRRLRMRVSRQQRLPRCRYRWLRSRSCSASRAPATACRHPAPSPRRPPSRSLPRSRHRRPRARPSRSPVLPGAAAPVHGTAASTRTFQVVQARRRQHSTRRIRLRFVNV